MPNIGYTAFAMVHLRSSGNIIKGAKVLSKRGTGKAAFFVTVQVEAGGNEEDGPRLEMHMDVFVTGHSSGGKVKASIPFEEAVRWRRDVGKGDIVDFEIGHVENTVRGGEPYVLHHASAFRVTLLAVRSNIGGQQILEMVVPQETSSVSVAQQREHERCTFDPYVHYPLDFPRKDIPFCAFATKYARHRIFVQWLVRTFGEEFLKKGTGVMDVAGGKGLITMECVLRSIPAICVDPVLHEGKLRKGIRKRLKKSGYDAIPHLREAWGADMSAKALKMLDDASVIVAMHPDEVTESVVRIALERNKPFAVVPCCVFPRLFPNRRLKSGKTVVTHSDFCKYLRELGPPGAIEATSLPFRGQATVIFSLALNKRGV